MKEEEQREIWNRKLIIDHNGRWVSFMKLPREARNAAIIYQFGSGSEWGKIEKAHITEARQELKERTKGKLWGLASVPTEKVKVWVYQFNHDIKNDWATFDDYHKWYIGQGDIPKHTGRQWPVILSGFMDEFIQDGWHRMHCYIRDGRKNISVLFFP